MPKPVATHSNRLSSHAHRVTPEDGAPPAVDPPTITSFTPNHGSEGTDVVITGTNFDGLTSVMFGTKSAVTSGRIDTEVTATVPTGASTGKITVNTVAGSVDTATNFKVDATTSGVAPDYSAYVTRKSVGAAGNGNQDYLDQLPAMKISRLDVQASLVNYQTLNAAVTAAATSITLNVPSGTAFPSVPFEAKVDDEYVKVTAMPSTGTVRTGTIVRAQRGSTAAAHAVNAGFTSWNWSATDSKVKKALDNEVELLMLITYNCTDYTGWGDQMAVPVKNGGAHKDAKGHTFDEWKTWWAENFCAEVMQRYSRFGNANPTSGVLANKIGTTTASGFKYDAKFVEVWNEANNIQFWAPNNEASQIKRDWGSLNGAITSTATSIAVTVNNYSDPPVPFDIVIDSEVMTVTAISGTGTARTCTVTRAASPKNVSHTSGKAVTLFNNSGVVQDYAELMAAAYDALKDIDANIYPGSNGLAARGGYANNGIGPAEYMQDMCDHFDTMGYTKHTNGWADVPLDWVGHHPYAPNGRGGGSQVSSPALSPFLDNSTNKYAVVTVAVHNVVNAKGWGSLKIWGTESGDNWMEIAVTNFGYRGDPPSSSYVQHGGGSTGDPFPKYDRSIMSANEEYATRKLQYDAWQGTIAWPAKSTNIPRWDVLGKDTPAATDPLPLGPLFNHASGKELHGVESPPEPKQYEYHFGLWNVDGSIKVAATGKDMHDLFSELAKLP